MCYTVCGGKDPKNFFRKYFRYPETDRPKEKNRRTEAFLQSEKTIDFIDFYRIFKASRHNFEPISVQYQIISHFKRLVKSPSASSKKIRDSSEKVASLDTNSLKI